MALNVVKFNYEGDLFFTGSNDKLICLWDSFTLEKIGDYKTKGAVKCLDVT